METIYQKVGNHISLEPIGYIKEMRSEEEFMDPKNDIYKQEYDLRKNPKKLPKIDFKGILRLNVTNHGLSD